MMLDFDIEIATIAVNCGTGRIVTREGREVIITCWNSRNLYHYPIKGYIPSISKCPVYWTNKGKYTIASASGDNKYDLFIEELC